MNSKREVQNNGGQEFFRQFSLFSDFTSEELADIEFLARPIRLEAGQSLFHQGDQPDGMYLVQNGLVGITARLPGDEVVELGRLGAGELIGEVSLVDHSVRTASAKILENMEGYFFSKIHFGMLQYDLRSSAFHAMNKITLILCVRIRGMIGEIKETLPRKKELEDQQFLLQRKKPKHPKPFMDKRDLKPELLRQLPLFADFTDDDFKSFLPPLKCLYLKRGKKLFDEGDKPEKCYLVIRGALHLYVSSKGTSEQLMVLGPGQIAGDIAMMDGGPQPATCEVRENSIVLEMPYQVFEKFRSTNESAGFKFFTAINRSLVGKLRKNIRNTARLASQGRISLGRRGGYRLPSKKPAGSLYPPDPVQ